MMTSLTIDELRGRARQRLPQAVFDFIDGAAEDEVTLRRNRRAFDDWSFSSRTLVDVSRIDQSVTLLGERFESPLILAPTGLCGMAAPRGELLAVRAAGAERVVFTASCMSAVTIEEIAAAATGPVWFQLYPWRDRALTRSLIERAARAGCTALVITVDVPRIGQRERDVRNGATIPPRVTLRNAWDTLRRPSWLIGNLRNPRIEFANVTARKGGTGRPFALSGFVNEQFDPSITWADLEWLRSSWSGPVLLKGIMSTEDAIRAADHGIDAIVVSNHGGRQLDGLPASLDVLAEIADAVGTRTEVVFDGGIRRGSDVVKALALGARACMIGRAYLYGLGANGEAGVRHAITILRRETERTMALLGRSAVTELDRSAVRPVAR